MLKVNETKCLFQHEPCKCKCRLSEKVCNLRQKWDCGKCPWIRFRIRLLEFFWKRLHVESKYMWLWVIRNVKLGNIKKCLFGKLVLACKYEILNTTEK